MVIDFKQCTLAIKDGTGTPLSVTASFGEGMFQWTRRTPRKYVLDRGKVSTGTVRNDDESPLEVQFSALLNFLISNGSESVTIYEALHREGAAASWVSTDTTDDCAPYSCNLEFTFTPVCVTTTKPEKQVCPLFRVEECTPDIKGGLVSFRGRCKAIAPTITRP